MAWMGAQDPAQHVHLQMTAKDDATHKGTFFLSDSIETVYNRSSDGGRLTNLVVKRSHHARIR